MIVLWRTMCILHVYPSEPKTQAGPDCPLCRLYHGRGPRPPINCQFLSRCVARRSAPPDKKNAGYAYEKRASALRWHAPPRMVNLALNTSVRTSCPNSFTNRQCESNRNLLTTKHDGTIMNPSRRLRNSTELLITTKSMYLGLLFTVITATYYITQLGLTK